MRVMVFGDSIGQGFYDDIGGGWVQMLQRDYLAEAIAGKSDVNIFNLGVSGNTSSEVLDRIESETRARQNSEPLLTLLAIGTNDSYERNGQRRTPEEKFAENIDAIIAKAKTFGSVLVLGCPACVDDRVQPTSWDANLHYTNERLRTYEAILQDCAKRAGVDFLPLWQTTHGAQQMQETMPDGLHPNNNGHKVIYGTVKQKLEQFA